MNKILTYPHQELRQKSEEITSVDRHVRRLIKDLETTLIHHEIGVGLAAPQIGINRRAFAICEIDQHDQKSHFQYFLNPTIEVSEQPVTLGVNGADRPDLEGCLSVPHIYAPVWRAPKIKLRYQIIIDDQLVDQTEEFINFPARIVQHEFDHLDGILFIDRVLEQGTPIYFEDKKGKLTEITKTEMFKLLK